MLAVFRSGWILGIGDQFVVSGGTFICGLVVARTSSQAEFGLFALGMTIVSLFSDVHVGAVSTPQAIRIHRYVGLSRREYIGSTLVHQTLLSASLSIALGMAWLLCMSLDRITMAMSPVILAIAITCTFTFLREYWRRYLFIKNAVTDVFLFDLAVTFFQVTAVFGMAALGAATASIAHAVMGTVCACFAMALLAHLRGELCVSGQRIWPDFKANFEIGGWLLTNGILWSLGIYAYPWLLATMHGASATGLWAACMGVVGIANTSLLGVLNVLTPRIASARATGGLPLLRRYVFMSALKYVALAFAVVSVPITAGEFLVTLVYGPQFGGSSGLIAVLAVNVVIMAASSCVARGLMVVGRASWDFVVNLGAIGIVFTFGWWNTAAYGPFGAAVGLTVANALGTLVRVMAFEIVSRPSTAGGGS